MVRFCQTKKHAEPRKSHGTFPSLVDAVPSTTQRSKVHGDPPPRHAESFRSPNTASRSRPMLAFGVLGLIIAVRQRASSSLANPTPQHQHTRAHR